MTLFHAALNALDDASNLACAVLAAAYLQPWLGRSLRIRPVVIGCTCALIPDLSMAEPVIVEGLRLDGRNAVLVVAGLWGGPLASLVAGAIVGAARWHI